MKALLVTTALAWGTVPTVIDGDTKKVAGVPIRLVDYDSPELFHPRCPSEYRLALQAKQALQVRIADLKLTPVPCATHNYGRLCARADQLASDMIAAGLGARYICTIGCPPKRNWCASPQCLSEEFLNHMNHL